jgi:GTP-binding protein
VGKSSLTNALCGEERVIVADVAGTTRDAIDVPLETKEGNFVLIDTAGLRKKNQIEQDLEFYAACRTERAVKRADVVLLVLDASDEVGIVDKKLAHFCEVEGKPTVIVLNKWDLAEAGGAKRDDYLKWLRDRLPGLKYAPAVFTCALTKFNLSEALQVAVELHAEARSRVATADLNRLLEVAMQRRRPKRVSGHEVKAYYMTQIGRVPPTFMVFVNRNEWIDPTWSRFLENWLREHLPFRRIPMVIKYKSRDSRYHEQNDRHRVIQAKNRASRTATLIIPKGSKKKQKKVGPRPTRKPKK